MLKIGIISLGCPRNLLDSEIMAGSLKKYGTITTDIEKGVDVCIVNTCAFVESARKESVDTILEAAHLKKSGKIKHLVICGCLPQLYKEKLFKELEEADLILGTSDFPKLPDFIKTLKIGNRKWEVSDHPDYLYDEKSTRSLFTPPHYAYVKVSEGCSNFCSYCIISRLRGAFRSRSVKSVVEEIKCMAKGGRLKEVNLIGQDTTLFGIDRYGKIVFPVLLRRICALENSVRWIRILYTHPAHYNDELIDTIRDEGKICKYLDLPVQHISDDILKRMNRRTSRKSIEGLIEKLRKKIPGIVLRTSIIVGFPGESDKNFKELLEFIRQTRFERLGAFIYSMEEGTRAASFKDQVPDKVKKERLDELMKLQQRISSDINRSFLGKTVEVMIDEKVEGDKDKFLGRTEGDAPEVDGIVYVSGKGLEMGDFCKVKIDDTMEYDLVGHKV